MLNKLGNVFQILIALAVALVASVPAVSSQTLRSRLDAPVAQFSTNRTSSLDQLIDLGKQLRVPLGIEWRHQADEPRVPPVNLQNSSLRQILAHILSRQPAYAFRETQGVVHVYNKKTLKDRANVLNLRLPDFTILNESLFGVTYELRNSIKQALRPAPARNGGYGYDPDRADGFDRLWVTIEAEKIKVREVLNQAVAKQGNALWVVVLHTELNLTRFDGHPDQTRCYIRVGRCSWPNRKGNLPLSSNWKPSDSSPQATSH